MKIINSSSISSFGGLNIVLKEFDKLNIDHILQQNLPNLPKQSKYSWKDLFYSFWGMFFCGGDCTEDLSIHLKDSLKSNPFIKIPSPDRVLNRMKDLSYPKEFFITPRGKRTHEFSFNDNLNILNMKLLKQVSAIQKQKNILDYDNTSAKYTPKSK